MTVSAAVKLIPSPPALVLNKNTKISLLKVIGRKLSQSGREREREREIREHIPVLKIFHHVTTIHYCGWPIKPQIPVFPIVHIILQRVIVSTYETTLQDKNNSKLNLPLCHRQIIAIQETHIWSEVGCKKVLISKKKKKKVLISDSFVNHSEDY